MATKVDKLWKQAVKEQQKRLKPGECQKYVRLVLDSRFLQTDFGSELVRELSNAEIKYEIRRLEETNCIIWERCVGQRTLALDSGVLNEDWQQENQVMRVVFEIDYQRALKEEKLNEFGMRLQQVYPTMQHTIIVPRLKDKHGHHASALIELQVLHQFNVIQLSQLNTIELVAHLRRYTKSIAEAPYKKQRAEILGGFKKYLANDKKQCVRVENGNGYGRLWQQHLNRLPLVTLEVAETIIEKYPCPKKLIEHFASDPQAVASLADLPVQGSGRRIGKVLASKLYTLYNTRDPLQQL